MFEEINKLLREFHILYFKVLLQLAAIFVVKWYTEIQKKSTYMTFYSTIKLSILKNVVLILLNVTEKRSYTLNVLVGIEFTKL